MKNEEISFTPYNTQVQFEVLLEELGLTNSERVYRALMQGQPLGVETFAKLIEVEEAEAVEILKYYGETNSVNEVTGFLGLSLNKTVHQINIQDKTLYTWCAMDTVLFPKYMLLEAEITSRDPVSNEVVKLAVNDDFLEWTDPVPLYISWMERAQSCEVRKSFCNHSHFIATEETAHKWLQENPKGKISLVDDLFSFAAGGTCC